MSISVFVSRPTPYRNDQNAFADSIKKYLITRGLSPRTLGDTGFDMDEVLPTIRRLMIKSNGLITIAFRCAIIKDGVIKPDSDIPGIQSSPITGKWMTSPFCHIETAMAFQLGLPILILREKDVIEDGVLEKGIAGLYLPEFELTADVEKDFLKKNEWSQMVNIWEARVRTVARNKGRPPILY
jgi:hypothetical protein